MTRKALARRIAEVLSKEPGTAARSTDELSRGGGPISPNEIRMNTNGHRLGRLVYPLEMDYLPAPSTCLLLAIRAIILQTIYFQSIKSIRRQ